MSLLFRLKAENDYWIRVGGFIPKDTFKHVAAAFDERRIPARHIKGAEDLTFREQAHLILMSDRLDPCFSCRG
jgi:hypothetical protein